MIDKKDFTLFLNEQQWEETHAFFHKKHPHLKIDYRLECNDFNLCFRWGSSYASFQTVQLLTTSIEDIPDIYRSYLHECTVDNNSIFKVKTHLEKCHASLYKLGCVYKWGNDIWKTREGMQFKLWSYEDTVNLVKIKEENLYEEILIEDHTDLCNIIYPDNYALM